MFRILGKKNLTKKNLAGLMVSVATFLISLVLLARESHKPSPKSSLGAGGQSKVSESLEVGGVATEKALDEKTQGSDDRKPESGALGVSKVESSHSESDSATAEENEDEEIEDQEGEASEEEKDRGEEKEISVQLKINTGEQTRTYDVKVFAESTVFDCLEKASSENNFSFDYTEYSFGIFVEELLGVRSDKKEGKYWIYYVNGKSADRGADSFVVSDGDEIYWEYKKVM